VGGWSTPRPGRFIPGKETRYPLYRRLGRPQDWSGWVLKISPPTGFDPRTVQLVPSRYTDYAIPAFKFYNFLMYFVTCHSKVCQKFSSNISFSCTLNPPRLHSSVRQQHTQRKIVLGNLSSTFSDRAMKGAAMQFFLRSSYVYGESRNSRPDGSRMVLNQLTF
jgi:hypothetical protein